MNEERAIGAKNGLRETGVTVAGKRSIGSIFCAKWMIILEKWEERGDWKIDQNWRKIFKNKKKFFQAEIPFFQALKQKNMNSES